MNKLSICQSCGEEFNPRENGHKICLGCEERLMYEEEENHYITVTKEMAMDACDLSLEGQTWKW